MSFRQFRSQPTKYTGDELSEHGIVVRKLDTKKNLQWIAAAMLFGGAFLISVLPKMAVGWEVFLVFMAGHTLLVADAIIEKHYPFLALNVSFLMLDLFAIYIRI